MMVKRAGELQSDFLTGSPSSLSVVPELSFVFRGELVS